MPNEQVAGAHRRWRLPFRCCGSRRESAVAQLSTLDLIMPAMIGTGLNVAGIRIVGVAGLARRRPLSPSHESYLKVVLGAFTVFYGLRLTWISLNGSLPQILKQLLIVVIAMMLGKLT